MPFTAAHPEAGLLDATLPDLGCNRQWSDFHRQVSPRPAIVCPECGWGVHAKLSPLRVKFFCHDPGRPDTCSLRHESMDHHMLKLELAGAIRDAGWCAQLEVAAADWSWRADVMASSPDGARRMAWEAQLSPISEDDIRARTERYAAEDIAVCWVSPVPQPPRWIGAVPGVSVYPAELVRPMTVRAGLVGFDPGAGRWAVREERLGQFVRWVLDGKVELVTVGRRAPHLWWTSARSIRAREAWAAARAEEERARRAEEERSRQEAEEEARRRREEMEEERLRARDEAERANPALRYQREEDEYREQQRAEQRAQLAAEIRERAERQAQRDAEALASAERFRIRSEERERAGAAWWDRLSREQIEALFAAVTEQARGEGATINLSCPPRTDPRFGYGVPVYRSSPIGMFGVVRPCPALLEEDGRAPWHRIFYLSGEEEHGAELQPGPTLHYMCGSNGSAL
ncbi:competence protein CoiA family protein [Streptomyces sp. NPDC093514]|uniref:competence protein CoiA family protein n=1 Tax=Streptomyces sp. NPDC093514 TaxID=3366039 RepID=UPI0038056C14